ncbi:MAG TPA: metallophosphoesterase [Anaerolineales bacterium]|nr:metallophosphoesterase [Anaerolineales bacterium]
MKILSLSDIADDLIYSPQVSRRFAEVDLILSCGDLPYYYLEYVISSINKPMFFVRGNHSSRLEYSTGGERSKPLGAEDLHRKVVVFENILLAGVEGCLRYRTGPFQYSQTEMWGHVFALLPGLLKNRAVYGRYLDVFVTHAPPWGIHDQPDLPHHGINSFRWLLRVFKPAFHFHGHIHVYRQDTITKTRFYQTQVINSYGYVEADINPGERGFAPLGVFLERSASITKKPNLFDSEDAFKEPDRWK